ncbi:phosphoglycerate mutase-like protein [Phellopilus nigrolimitatus]|nr:phosphoglycerate mutase-like protein [Phellopilus nigrolimitatus]
MSAKETTETDAASTAPTTEKRRYLAVCVSFVRHGHCLANLKGHFRDDPWDPLTDRGRQQAAALGARWKDVRIDALLSSHLTRAKDTAQAIADANIGHPEVVVEDNLHERKYGTYVDGIKDTPGFYRAVNGYSSFGSNPDRTHRPICGGESFSDVAERAYTAMVKILSKYGKALDEPYREQAKNLPDDIPHVVIVSHNIFLTELYECILQWHEPRWNKSDEHEWSSYHLSNTGWSRHILCWELIPNDTHDPEQRFPFGGPMEMETVVDWS